MKRGFIETRVERTAPDEAVGTIEASPRLDYLAIPVVAKLEYGLARAALHALAGPLRGHVASQTRLKPRARSARGFSYFAL